MRRPFPFQGHAPWYALSLDSCRSANNRHVKHESDLERLLCQGKTPEPSLRPRSRGWPRPLIAQGPDWTVPHLYAPYYTARYLMFCQSSQTKTFAAALCTSDFPPQYRLLPSQSPMVPRCALPPRPRPSFGEPAALLIGRLAYKSHGSRLRGLGRQDDHGLQPLFVVEHRLTVARQNREVLAAGVRWPEIPQGLTRSIAAACSSEFSRMGPLKVAVSGLAFRYKLFEAAMAVAVA